jgi:ADP-heptose:LPS heptosyltransferase
MLAGRTGLRELASLVAGAALVICGDTGVGHLATAFGTPSVLLFGPTPPSRWGPPVRRSRHRVLWAGSVGDPHGDRIDPGLARLTEEDVLNECHELLEVLANG